MKKNSTQAKRRAFEIKDAIPLFVSIVGRGANLTPFAQVKYGEDGKFSEVDISRIYFDKAKFATEQSVKDYLDVNEYSDYTVVDEEGRFSVAAKDESEFESVSELKVEPGVTFMAGKLKTPTETEQPAAEVESVEVAFSETAETETLQESEDKSVLDTVSETVNKVEGALELATDAKDIVDDVKEVISDVEDGIKEVVADVTEHKLDEIVPDVKDAVNEVAESVSNLIDDIKEAVKDGGEKGLFTSAKFSGDYASFRDQMTSMLERGTPVGFDSIMYTFMDTVWYSVYNQQMDQLKENCADLYKFFVSYENSIKNMKFSDEQVITDAEREAIRAEIKAELEAEATKVVENAEFSQEAIDTPEELVQNSSNISLTEQKISTKIDIDPSTVKYNDRMLENYLGL